jgi:hypothetical protein
MQQVKFIDVSSLVVGTPGKGHLFSFHSNLVQAANASFSDSVIFGPVVEASGAVVPIFTRKYFERGPGNLFQKIGMKQDIFRANIALDIIPGTKVLHFYEGSLRDLTFLAELLAQRRDIVAVFNFFSLDPWTQILTSKFPGSKYVRSSLSGVLRQLSENVAFTCDSTGMQSLFAKHLNLKQIQIYPLFSSVRSPARTDLDWSERRYSFLFTPRTWSEQRLVIKALEILASSATSTHCVSISPRWKSNFNPRKIRNLQGSAIKVEVIKAPLSQDEYSELFHKSKVVVLPYLDKHYVFGSSGKVLDSRMAHCLTVAPIRTAAGQLIREKGWGRFFDYSPKSLAAVLTGIDLETKTKFLDEEPNVGQSITRIMELTRSLKHSESGATPRPFLYFLPFLLGMRGMKWTLTHLVALPIWRAAIKWLQKKAR